MRFELTERGDLRVSTEGNERQLLRRAKRRKDFVSNDFLMELFGESLANEEYGWCQPEEIGALTSAPILCTRDEDGNVAEAWGFMDYALRSPQEDLLEKGEAIFQRGN